MADKNRRQTVGAASAKETMSASNPKHKVKEGLIGLEEAADYLGCSHQYLGKILNDNTEEHELKHYFRNYAGRWRTTYALLDEYWTNAKLVGAVDIRSQNGNVD